MSHSVNVLVVLTVHLWGQSGFWSQTTEEEEQLQKGCDVRGTAV